MGIEEYIVERIKTLEEENRVLQSQLVQLKNDYQNSLSEIELLEQGYQALELVERNSGTSTYYTTRELPNAEYISPQLKEIFERLAKKYDY